MNKQSFGTTIYHAILILVMVIVILTIVYAFHPPVGPWQDIGGPSRSPYWYATNCELSAQGEYINCP